LSFVSIYGIIIIRETYTYVLAKEDKIMTKFTDYKVEELRKMASKAGIKNYTKYSKLQLIDLLDAEKSPENVQIVEFEAVQVLPEVPSSEKLSKSDEARALLKSGMTVAEVAKWVGLTYSHVWQLADVLGTSSTTQKGDTKKHQIKKLLNQGHTRTAVAKRLGVSYSWVHRVWKEMCK
jgi:predicted transcriptional regulator